MSIPLKPLPQSPSQSPSQSQSKTKPTHSLSTHLIFLTGLTTFFLPLTLLPYLYARRRRVGSLQNRVRELEGVVEGMYREMRIREMEMKMKMREKEREDECREIQSDIRYLLDQAKITRRHTQGMAVKSIGLSLADIASFIHQVELSMPTTATATATATDNKNRVDRLWVTALMLQNLKLK
ncbi:hypothetical protein DFH05DRAFT_1196619 [Lentinula detonsa]|uniref:Uncharacterized protein n=1 Tax=Lentinula detonsa TaxID=2804962 RepID=A0A9W8NYC9_9AGAR|nr:hypothetical protein DFH05DRAFT_1196619 [Lentinula detonsa]